MRRCYPSFPNMTSQQPSPGDLRFRVEICSTVTVAYCKKALNKTNRWWVFYEAQTQWGEIDNKNWIVAHMSSSIFIGQPHQFLHCIPFGTMQCYVVEGKPCETL